MSQSSADRRQELPEARENLSEASEKLPASAQLERRLLKTIRTRIATLADAKASEHAIPQPIRLAERLWPER